LSALSAGYQFAAQIRRLLEAGMDVARLNFSMAPMKRMRSRLPW